MQYFSKDFIAFFKELEKNNNKEWFDENRNRYKNTIKEPFKNFVADVIRFISSEDPEIRLEPKDCIFRINRDIRFSKDKTPYKTNVSCAITPGGKKDMVSAGIYLELSACSLKIYSGVYQPNKEELLRIRRHISDNLSDLKNLLNKQSFKNDFGELRGEKNKVIPKEFKELSLSEEIIKHKQFYFYRTHRHSLITSDTLMAQIMKDYHTISPLIQFFREAIT